MDIDLLAKMVKELILDNDRVVLPGLGAFVAETIPSTFTDKGYTINPPYRRLSFRSKPDEGDLLTEFYASSNGIELKMADKVIRDFVADLKSILYIRKTVVFPGLGRMRATKENTVFFVADENLDIYPDGIGLEAISLKTHQETKEEVEAAVVGLKAIVEDPKPQSADLKLQSADLKLQPEEPKPVSPEPLTLPISEAPVTDDIQPVAAPSPLNSTVEIHEVTAKIDDENPVNSGKTLKVMLWIILAIIAFLAIFIMAARMYPQLLDRVLYSPEELEILDLK